MVISLEQFWTFLCCFMLNHMENWKMVISLDVTKKNGDANDNDDVMVIYFMGFDQQKLCFG